MPRFFDFGLLWFDEHSLDWQIYHLREVAGKSPEIEKKNLEWVSPTHWWFQADWNKHHVVTSQHYTFLFPGKRELPAVMCCLAAHCGARAGGLVDGRMEGWRMRGLQSMSRSLWCRGALREVTGNGMGRAVRTHVWMFSIERESGEGIFRYNAWNAKELSFQVFFASNTDAF